jgi:putative nucleotidyltransferase with HDIG domain
MIPLEIITKHPEQFAAPQVACKLSRIIKKEPHSDEIISLVQCDPALAVKILQVCNSAAYHSREPITSMEAAVSWLGHGSIFKIVWKLSMAEKMVAPLPGYGMELGALWRHSLTTAFAAEALLNLTDQVDADSGTAFTAALLHDFGKVMIELNMRAEIGKAGEFCVKQKVTTCEAEQALFGINHAMLGGVLLKHWEQPAVLTTAVSHHHSPEAKDGSQLARLVNLADLCTHAMGNSYGWGAMALPVSKEAMSLLKIDQFDMQVAMAEVQARAAEVELFMAMV